MILGAEDVRTIRKHILRGRQIIDEANLELTQVLSGLPGFSRLPEQKPAVGRHIGLFGDKQLMQRIVESVYDLLQNSDTCPQ